MELIIQKATELGVSAIIPFKSERSISLEERERKQRKAHRWQGIAVKAVQQSRRAEVPRVEYCRSFQEALGLCEGEGLKVLLWEEKGDRLKEVLGRYQTKQGANKSKNVGEPLCGLPLQKIYAMVGPEGGFT